MFRINVLITTIDTLIDIHSLVSAYNLIFNVVIAICEICVSMLLADYLTESCVLQKTIIVI